MRRMMLRAALAVAVLSGCTYSKNEKRAAEVARCTPLKSQLRKLMCATDASFTEDNVTVHFDDAGRRSWFTSAATPAPSVSASAKD